MALIQKGFVSASEYNSLPTIQEAASVPEEYEADLKDLQRLLAKHDVPESVSIRLIHRHYDIADGEAMVFKDITLPAHGTVEVMRATPIVPAQLHGMNFFVSSASQLQAYEYTTDTTINIFKYAPFIAEFVEVMIERKLQHKFGLTVNKHSKIGIKTDRKEFEFPEEKCTITIPTNLPLPDATYDVDIDTVWGALDTKHKPKPVGRTECSHGDDAKHKPKRAGPVTRTKCSHAGYSPTEDCRGTCAKEDGMMFDGRIVKSGTPFHGLLNNLMEVW